MCRPNRSTFSVACSVLLAAPTGAPAPAYAQWTETEINDSKALATVIPALDHGQTITGLSTGGTVGGGADDSADYFDITTALAPAPGLYRYRLSISSDSPGHIGSIRGRTQLNGVINPSSDAQAQNSSTITTLSRYNQWYASEAPSRIYYRVAGTSATPEPYTLTLERTPVAVQAVGALNPGGILITSAGQGHSTDTDLWVYDSTINPIPECGNDDQTPDWGPTSLSRLFRAFGGGPFIVAISNFNLANDQPSPPDDLFRNGVVADFPNVLFNNNPSVGPPFNLAFSISDGATTINVSAIKPEPFGVFFASFTAVTPTGACCQTNGACTQTTGFCTGSFYGFGSVCSPALCPDASAGACCGPGTCFGSPAFMCNGLFIAGGVCSPNPCPDALGACCELLICSPTTAMGCAGIFHGPGTTCVSGTCQNAGACCYPDGTCSTIFLFECTSGVFRGPGTACPPNPPCPQPLGACCDPADNCFQRTQAECAAGGNRFLGVGIGCNPNPCPAFGACCLADGTCAPTTFADCQNIGGVFQGDMTLCDPGRCPRACCPPNFAPCQTLTPQACAAIGGTSHNQACRPDLCPQPLMGACCIGCDCSMTTPEGCAGNYLGAMVTCNPNPCPQDGACCLPPQGFCYITDQSTCTGMFIGPCTTCFPQPCPTPIAGACCDNIGQCHLAFDTDCDSSGVFLAGTGCQPNPCGSPAAGACCDQQGNCTFVREISCPATSRWLGVGRGCNNPNPCHQPPACRADYNNSGGVTVQDLFDYLAGYFSGNPSADFNTSGSITVQDLFDYLAAFFAGCA